MILEDYDKKKKNKKKNIGLKKNEMVYKRKPIVRKRRQFRRKRPAFKRIARVYRPIRAGMPTFMIQRLRYNYNGVFNLTVSGALQSYIMTTNDLRSPPATGGTHQPMAFDQWCPSLYGRFVVLGSKISCRFLPQYEQQSLTPCNVGVYVTETGIPLTMQRTIEMNRGKWTLMSQMQSHYVNLKAYYSAKKTHQIKNITDNLAVLSGSASTSPQKVAYFVVWGSASDDFTGGAQIAYNFTVEYFVKFYSPVDLAQS